MIDIREMGLDGMDWFDLAEDGDRWRAVVSRKMNLLKNDSSLWSHHHDNQSIHAAAIVFCYVQYLNC